MKVTISRQRIPAVLAVAALSILIVPRAGAQCGVANRAGATFAPASQSPDDLDAASPKALSQQAGSSQEQNWNDDKSDASIVGFWKKVYYSGGVLNDIGFEHWHADGTETLVDTPPPANGNVCLGAWKKIHPRTYSLVHPAFIFDTAGKVPVYITIERSRITVSADGNTFTGTFSQANYDFDGNVIPGSEFGGPVTGTRITPDGPFPFPFPH